MKLKDFIGKVVIGTETKRKYVLTEITSPEIGARETVPTANGYYRTICWKTINGDPFERGILRFEDASLEAPFRQTYDAHCRSKDGYFEEYGYWMRRD